MGGILSSLMGGDSSRVTAFHSSHRWELYFYESKQLNKLVVVDISAKWYDFSAKWYSPCSFMEPIIDKMSMKYTDVDFIKIDADFIKIDVDELPDVSREFDVEEMTTFLLLKQGKEVERVVGANTDELEEKIIKHREVPKFAV